jgi:hypothetical protein
MLQVSETASFMAKAGAHIFARCSIRCDHLARLSRRQRMHEIALGSLAGFLAFHAENVNSGAKSAALSRDRRPARGRRQRDKKARKNLRFFRALSWLQDTVKLLWGN